MDFDRRNHDEEYVLEDCPGKLTSPAKVQLTPRKALGDVKNNLGTPRSSFKPKMNVKNVMKPKVLDFDDNSNLAQPIQKLHLKPQNLQLKQESASTSQVIQQKPSKQGEDEWDYYCTCDHDHGDDLHLFLDYAPLQEVFVDEDKGLYEEDGEYSCPYSMEDWKMEVEKAEKLLAENPLNLKLSEIWLSS